MKIQPSTKLFKTKYPYRVTRTRSYNLENTGYETEKFSEVLDIARESWFDSDRDITTSILYPELAWGNRGDTNWYYIQSTEMLKRIVSIFAKEDMKIEGPVNDYHLSILKSSDYAVKNSLYYNKYRYFVDYGMSDDETTQRVKRLAIENKETMMAKGVYSPFVCYPKLYCLDDKDLMLAKLASENVKIVKAITIKEIKDHG